MYLHLMALELTNALAARNGSNIQGGTSDLDLTTNNQCVILSLQLLQKVGK